MLSPSKSITGVGDRVPTSSFLGLGDEASSRGSRAGLLTLCLLFECDPLTLRLFSDFDFLLRFLDPCPSSSDLRLEDPLRTSSSEALNEDISPTASSFSLLPLVGGLVNCTILFGTLLCKKEE